MEGELLRLKVFVMAESLKVGLALGGSLLKRLDSRLAFQFVGLEGGLDVVVDFEGVGKRNCILHRQPRTRADGEVGGVNGVAQEHNVLVAPLLVLDLDKVNPG